MAYAKLMYEVMDELRRAQALHPNQHLPWGGSTAWKRQADMYRDVCNKRLAEGKAAWVDILREEFFEAISEPNPRVARAELVQLAAMALRAIGDIDAASPPG